MTVKPTKIKRGDTALITAVVTDELGNDISGVTWKVAHILDSQKNDDQDTYPWEDPHALSEAASTSVYLVRRLVVDAALASDASTKYRVFVKATDNPEILAVDCGTYTVMP
jgi:hypothetical protein